ncbi:Myosin N-terminal SH3-like domain [Globodera pallida]|nr:Myosin N-terminal SH3-like domain [Globodera pallida]
MTAEIKKFARHRGHEEADSPFVIVLTHGNEKRLFGIDEQSIDANAFCVLHIPNTYAKDQDILQMFTRFIRMEMAWSLGRRQHGTHARSKHHSTSDEDSSASEVSEIDYDSDFSDGGLFDAAKRGVMRLGLNRGRERIVHTPWLLGRQRQNSTLANDEHRTDIFKEVEHEQGQSTIVCLMSHGRYDGIFGSDDNVVNLHAFIGHLNGENCPLLINKRKIFLVASCRGAHGVHLRESVGRSAGTSAGRIRNSPRRRSRERHHQSHEILARVPKNKDMMLAFSTAPHHVSIRNPRKGTWFFQSVAAVIAEHCHDTELLRLHLPLNMRLLALIIMVNIVDVDGNFVENLDDVIQREKRANPADVVGIGVLSTVQNAGLGTYLSTWLPELLNNKCNQHEKLKLCKTMCHWSGCRHNDGEPFNDTCCMNGFKSQSTNIQKCVKFGIIDRACNYNPCWLSSPWTALNCFCRPEKKGMNYEYCATSMYGDKSCNRTVEKYCPCREASCVERYGDVFAASICCDMGYDVVCCLGMRKQRIDDVHLRCRCRPWGFRHIHLPSTDPEEGYLEAEITSTKGEQVTVKVGDSERTVKKEMVQEMNPPKFEKTEDMSNLTFLNDASVLYNLRARYKAMLIYTYSGLFCVVINPYKRLPIYTDTVARMFMGKRRNEMPPHLFAVSDEAYRNMLQNRENQSMLITGESGAGKTENTKKVIAYFASVGASQLEAAGAEGAKPKNTVTLEDQIVQTNPVLEAFGNAKTVRNNNSSRFGKFIRIHFNRAGRVASCDIEHYLLEKSRVIRQAPGERCYHIFYQIFSDFKPELKKKLKLTKPLKEYVFVAQAELTIDGVDDKEEFKLTDEAFDVLNFNEQEKSDCYQMMSGIMHMGNMKFKQRPREEQAEADETEEAAAASDMFGMLLNALVKPRVRVGNEWVSKGQNMEQVSWAIGAMAKALYARIFDWLVKKCNVTLDQKGLSRDSFIGVLDIAGFEIFDVRLCVPSTFN